MNLNINKIGIPQVNCNNPRKVGFGEKGVPAVEREQIALEKRVAQLEETTAKHEEKLKLYRQFVPTTIDQLHTLSKPIGKADSPDMLRLCDIHKRLIELDRLA